MNLIENLAKVRYHIHWYDNYPYHGIFDSPAEMIKSLSETYCPDYFSNHSLYLIMEIPQKTFDGFTYHITKAFTCTFDGKEMTCVNEQGNYSKLEGENNPLAPSMSDIPPT